MPDHAAYRCRADRLDDAIWKVPMLSMGVMPALVHPNPSLANV
jgi:hypothetical protein